MPAGTAPTAAGYCVSSVRRVLHVGAVVGVAVAVHQPRAFPAGARTRYERAHLDKRAVVARVDPRALRGQAGPVRPGPQLGRLVGAEQEHVAVPGQARDVLDGGSLKSLAGDLDVAVEAAEPGDRCFGLWPAEVILGVDDLPAEVGEFHLVGVHAVQAPDAAGGQRHGGDSAGAANAEDRHPGRAQPRLRVP